MQKHENDLGIEQLNGSLSALDAGISRALKTLFQGGQPPEKQQIGPTKNVLAERGKEKGAIGRLTVFWGLWVMAELWSLLMVRK